ncbi:MAG: nucleoside diphosphate kinase regulator [Tissierellales bacterium]|nr:nucleoside diphosphate kinase regulator [Tissierellales bacterium]MBN2828467.1 nucleoside diphosphate kinase regulator [Tissierellales bacterium]
MAKKRIYITENDKKKLEKLIQEARHQNLYNEEYIKSLITEIEIAKVVKSKSIPKDVITMNSQVRLISPDGEEEDYTLVFPNEADVMNNKISILAPVGTAMIGYKVGDVIEWPVPEGIVKFVVKEILYQPEAEGDYE